MSRRRNLTHAYMAVPLLVPIVLLILLLCSGCKSRRSVISEQRRDSLALAADSVSVRESTAASVESESEGACAVVIEFEPGGGAVAVDSTGRTVLHGVKAIHANGHTAAKLRATAVVASDSTAMTATLAGSHVNQRESRPVASGAIESGASRVFSLVGQGVCIAALLWLLFLYLLRRRP